MTRAEDPHRGDRFEVSHGGSKVLRRVVKVDDVGVTYRTTSGQPRRCSRAAWVKWVRRHKNGLVVNGKPHA